MSTRASIFIDGEAGTTGLQIAARLRARSDIELIAIDPSARKDTHARREALNAADIAILCLPDSAAVESVGMVDNSRTCIIDASTAHRTAGGWTYGFPEYSRAQREQIKNSKRIANPGCYALAAVAILHPLIEAGLLTPDWPLSINGISGYSGGGKALIKAFEDPASEGATDRVVYDYALGLTHKHVPEITRWGGLAHAPIFLPTVGRYYKGMLVHVPLALWAMANRPSAKALHGALDAHYGDEPGVEVAAFAASKGLSELDPEALNDTNKLCLYVLHNDDDNAIVVAQLDNLGKGASGQVMQTINVVLGIEENTGI